MESVSIGDKTLAYWNASSAFHNKPSRTPNLNVESAIKLCGDNLAVLNPARPLAYRFQVMRESIIMGTSRGRKKKDQPAATVLKLARR